MTFVDGLQVIGFPPPCHPSYEALALTSAGLSPAERASLCWTHKYSLQLSAALPKTTMLCQSTRCWCWPCLSVYASSVATEKLATGCPLVGRCRSSGSWPRWPMRVTLLSDILLSSFCAPRLGLQPGRGAFVYLFAGSCPSAFHVAPSALAAPSALRSEMKQFQWNTALLAHRWSGSRSPSRRLPPPKNRTCESPRIRLKPFKGARREHPVSDGGPSAMDLPMAVGMQQNEIVDAVGTAQHPPHQVMCVPSRLGRDLLEADRTSAFLSVPKPHEPGRELLFRRTLLARLEVGFPFRVVGIRFGFDFDVPPNGSVGDLHQSHPFRLSARPLLARRE